MKPFRRHYIDTAFGQLHYASWGHEGEGKPILLCLAPSPFSSIAYCTLAPLLIEKYHVVALDYPGFGNSDHSGNPITIRAFAEATLILAHELKNNADIDLLGFHTGCLVGIEASCIAAKTFRQLILIDVPFFTHEKQADLLLKNYGQLELSPDLICLQPVWNSCVKNRIETLGIQRCYELFVDQASLAEEGSAAFKAAFQYDCFRHARDVFVTTTVIATKAGLYEESIAAHEAITGSKLIEVPEVSVAVLEQAASKIAQIILSEI